MEQLCNPVPTVLLLVGQALNHIPVLHGFIVFPPQAQLLGQTLPVRDAYVDGLRRCPTHAASISTHRIFWSAAGWFLPSLRLQPLAVCLTSSGIHPVMNQWHLAMVFMFWSSKKEMRKVGKNGCHDVKHGWTYDIAVGEINAKRCFNSLSHLPLRGTRRDHERRSCRNWWHDLVLNVG